MIPCEVTTIAVKKCPNPAANEVHVPGAQTTYMLCVACTQHNVSTRGAEIIGPAREREEGEESPW